MRLPEGKRENKTCTAGLQRERAEAERLGLGMKLHHGSEVTTPEAPEDFFPHRLQLHSGVGTASNSPKAWSAEAPTASPTQALAALLAVCPTDDADSTALTAPTPL